MGNTFCKDSCKENDIYQDKCQLIDIYETISDNCREIELINNEKLNISLNNNIINSTQNKLIKLIIDKNSIINKWLNKFNYPNNIKKLEINIINAYINDDQIDLITLKHNFYNKIEYDVIKKYELNDFIIILLKLEDTDKYWIILQHNNIGTLLNINNFHDPIIKLIRMIQNQLEYTILDDILDANTINEIYYNRYLKIKSANEYDRYVYIFNLNCDQLNTIMYNINTTYKSELNNSFILKELNWSNILNTNDSKLILGINYLNFKFPELNMN